MTEFNYFFGKKRYRALDGYFKEKYGGKVFKVSLNAGFTCPNIDGTKGRGGCTYCSPSGSGDFAGDPTESLNKQFDAVVAQMHKKLPASGKIDWKIRRMRRACKKRREKGLDN